MVMAFNHPLGKRGICEAMLIHPAVQYRLSPTFIKIAKAFGFLYIRFFGYPFDIPSRILARKMLNILRENPQGLVLDVGCSHGAFDFELARRGYEVIGIDLNQESLMVGNMIKEILGIENVTFYQMNILNGTFQNKRFDAVLMFETLEHIQEDSKAIQEIYRLLKKEGVLLLSVPYADRPQEYDTPIGACLGRDGSCHSVGEGGSHYRNGYRLEQLQELLGKAGFRVIQGEYICLPNWLHASIFTFPIKFPLALIGNYFSRNRVKVFVLAKKDG